jgi:hypothetical protein
VALTKAKVLSGAGAMPLTRLLLIVQLRSRPAMLEAPHQDTTCDSWAF